MSGNLEDSVDKVKADEQLILDPDEIGHLKRLDYSIRLRLVRSNEGAWFAVSRALDCCKDIGVDDPKFISGLLISKATSHIRFASTGIALGYYGEVAILLRSLLETLQLLSLILKDQKAARQWVLLTQQDFAMSDERRKESLGSVRARATRAYRQLFFGRQKEDSIDVVTSIYRKFSDHVHATFDGIRSLVSPGLGSLDVLGHSFVEALEHIPKGDFEAALSLSGRRTMPGGTSDQPKRGG